MATWLHVATIAFVTQLSVLPGEKGQFIVAGLSTRYHPLVVVAAAGSAFAGWTALEVAFGNALQGALPQLYLDLSVGLLFLLFAALLLRSAPPANRASATADGGLLAERTAGDGGAAVAEERSDRGDLEVRVPVLDWRVPNVLGDFLPIFALMAFGEFGDKTQLVTIGLAARYAHGTAIWVGEMAAIVPVSLLNAFLFARFSDRFDPRTAHLVGAALFVFFGVDTLQSGVTGVSAWDTVVARMADAGSAALDAVLATI